MGYESQGDFMGDDLDTDTDHLQVEADVALRNGRITKKDWWRRMDRIQRLQDAERERDWDVE